MRASESGLDSQLAEHRGRKSIIAQPLPALRMKGLSRAGAIRVTSGPCYSPGFCRLIVGSTWPEGYANPDQQDRRQR
jgi:hypothetical protein